MQTVISETESKSHDLSICVHHYTSRAPSPKGQGNVIGVLKYYFALEACSPALSSGPAGPAALLVDPLEAPGLPHRKVLDRSTGSTPLTRGIPVPEARQRLRPRFDAGKQDRLC